MKIQNIFFAVFLFTNSIFSQILTISGKINDAHSGNTLPYGNVRVINTTLGTAANANGSYAIKLTSGNYSLVASYIGYHSDTVTVELKNNLTGVDFILRKTEILLPEIVIRPGENPAMDIIRKVIEKKKERNSILNSYEFEAYTKGLVRTTDEISARGRTVSAGIGSGEFPLARVVKPLLVQGASKRYYLALCPGDRQVNLKTLARAIGEKTVDMAKREEVPKITGYVIGGVSRIGTHRPLPVVLEQSILGLPEIAVSAGQWGCQAVLRPSDLRFSGVGRRSHPLPRGRRKEEFETWPMNV